MKVEKWFLTSKKTKEVNMKNKAIKKVKLSEIKKPTTVEEFRVNLRKYFGGLDEDSLYVLPSSGDATGIKYEDINSFQDIYEITGDPRPSIVPLIDYDKSDVLIHMQKTNQVFSSDGFFHDDYKVYENAPGILMKIKNVSWFQLDNAIARELFVKVLGDYTGYALSEMKEVA